MGAAAPPSERLPADKGMGAARWIAIPRRVAFLRCFTKPCRGGGDVQDVPESIGRLQRVEVAMQFDQSAQRGGTAAGLLIDDERHQPDAAGEDRGPNAGGRGPAQRVGDPHRAQHLAQVAQQQQLVVDDQFVGVEDAGDVDQLDRPGVAVGDAGLAVEQLGPALILDRRAAFEGGLAPPGRRPSLVCRGGRARPCAGPQVRASSSCSGEGVALLVRRGDDIDIDGGAARLRWRRKRRAS